MKKITGIAFTVSVVLLLSAFLPSVAQAQSSWSMTDCIRTYTQTIPSQYSTCNTFTTRPEATADSLCDGMDTSASAEAGYQYDFDFSGSTLTPLYADLHIEADGSQVASDTFTGRYDDHSGANFTTNVYPAPYNSGLSNPGAGGDVDASPVLCTTGKVSVFG